MVTQIAIPKPLTVSEVEKHKRINKNRQVKYGLIFIFVQLIVLACTSWLLYQNNTHAPDYYISRGVCVAGDILVAYIILLGYLDLNSYVPIKYYEHEYLLRLCEDHPDMKDYYMQVAYTGRSFTRREFLDLKNIAARRCHEFHQQQIQSRKNKQTAN